MFKHNEDKFRISGPAVFDWQLVAENKACLDHAALMGMRKTPSDCAMACYSSAEYFSFGECSGGLCKCHCHKEGYDNTCTAFDHSYNLYSYAEPGKFCSANLLIYQMETSHIDQIRHIISACEFCPKFVKFLRFGLLNDIILYIRPHDAGGAGGEIAPPIFLNTELCPISSTHKNILVDNAGCCKLLQAMFGFIVLQVFGQGNLIYSSYHRDWTFWYHHNILGLKQTLIGEFDAIHFVP